MYEAVRHASPHEFLEQAERWLLEAEDRHNLVLSLAYARAESGSFGADTLFATVEDDGEVVGCAVRTPPYKVLITDLPRGAGAVLGRRLTEVYEAIPTVLGRTRPASEVAAGWVAERGGGWRLGLEQRIYRLDEVRSPRGVPGALRAATGADVELAVGWGEGFARDAGMQFAVPRTSVEAWIERGSLYIWEDEAPRSIAVAQGRTPNGIRIGYVYTPPESRGRGYASACVAEVSRRMLEDGLSFCVLYTDLSNPTSNAIYQRIGYEPIEDVRDIDLVAEPAR